MSRENAEVVSAVLDAFDRRDKAVWSRWSIPTWKWSWWGSCLTRSAFGPALSRVWDYLTFLDEDFEDIQVERGEYVELGGQGVVRVRWRGKGKTSGAEVGFSFTSVFTVSNGKLLRGRNYPMKAQALEAVGPAEVGDVAGERGAGRAH